MNGPILALVNVAGGVADKATLEALSLARTLARDSDAALEAIVGGEADVERMLAEYDRRRRLIVDGLNAIGLRTFEPRGAFYAFPRITSTGLDDETFAAELDRRYDEFQRDPSVAVP